MGFLRRILYSLLDKDSQCRGSNAMNQQSEDKQRTYRYNRRAGQKRRVRHCRCGQRGFGQRRFAQSAPTGNAALHDQDGTNSPGIVTGYPVYPQS